MQRTSDTKSMNKQNKKEGLQNYLGYLFNSILNMFYLSAKSGSKSLFFSINFSVKKFKFFMCWIICKHLCWIIEALQRASALSISESKPQTYTQRKSECIMLEFGSRSMLL